MRRVLVVAHAFPPCGGAGVQRIAKTVAYLGRSGWRPSVLTVDPSCYGLHDASQTNSGVERVVRTRCVDPVAHAASLESKLGPSDATAPIRRRLGPIRALARAGWVALERTILAPDRFILWYPFAIPAGVRMHRETPFDVVLTTGEPYSSFLIARAIARRIGVPFVLDMRDPWTLLPYRADRPAPLRAWIEQWQEARALEASAACIFANRAVDAYAARFPQLREKFHYVPNGYDPADFAGVEPRRFDRFTIVHNGTFLPGYRTADTFLYALRRVVDEEPSLRTRMRVQLVGKIGAERQLTDRLGLQDVVTHAGYRPHRESLSYVTGADALLLVGGSHRWEETGKIFEYLAAGRPILALIEPAGAAADLLRRTPATVRIVPRQAEIETAAAIRQMVFAGRRCDVPRPPWLAEYQRDTLAQRVARILEDAVRAAPGLETLRQTA